MGNYEKRLNAILFNLQKYDIDLGQPIAPAKELSVEELVVEMVKHGRRSYCTIPALIDRVEINMEEVIERTPQKRLKQNSHLLE